MRLPSHWNRAANAALFADSSQMMCESMRDGHVSITVALMTLRLVSMPMAWRMIVPGAIGLSPRSPDVTFKGTGFTGVRLLARIGTRSGNWSKQTRSTQIIRELWGAYTSYGRL